jgi:predicted lipoprotein with Yx(FWY)xxD motif
MGRMIFPAGKLLYLAAAASLILLAGCTTTPSPSATPSTSLSPTAPVSSPGTGPGQSPSPSRNPSSSPAPAGSPSATPSPSRPATPASSGAYSFGISSSPNLGSYLTDGNGLTLYYTIKDSLGVSSVSGILLQNWPVFYAANPAIPPSLNPSDFGTITRSDGQKQSTYIGYPLYRYYLDTVPGSTLGQGVGGVWFVISPQLFPSTSTAAPPSPSASGSPASPPSPSSSPAGTLSYGIASSPNIISYLVDGNGLTLYYNSNDSPGVSTVTGALLQTWPPFYTANITVSPSLKASDFGTITRSDGQKQSTFKGYPLYNYYLDTVPGSTLGQGIGGIWFIINPQYFPGTAIPSPSTSPISSPSPSASPPSAVAPAGVTIELIAQTLQFDKKVITVPAGAQVTINFNNKDIGKMHNFSVYTDRTATITIFMGSGIIGADHTTYVFTPPPVPGTYYFRDDNYSTAMYGHFIVK